MATNIDTSTLTLDEIGALIDNGTLSPDEVNLTDEQEFELENESNFTVAELRVALETLFEDMPERESGRPADVLLVAILEVVARIRTLGVVSEVLGISLEELITAYGTNEEVDVTVIDFGDMDLHLN